MKLEQAIEIIKAARERGKKETGPRRPQMYIGRYADFAASEFARIEGVEKTSEHYALACEALAKLNEGTSLTDMIHLKEKR